MIAPLSNGAVQSTRYCVIRLVSERKQKLSIGSFWEGLAKALPQPCNLVGRYSFSSPGIGADLVDMTPGGDPLVKDGILNQPLRDLKTKSEEQSHCIEGKFAMMFSKSSTKQRGADLPLKVWYHDFYPQYTRTARYSLCFVFDNAK